jgi:CBS domain containing-hemolysin-like protein
MFTLLAVDLGQTAMRLLEVIAFSIVNGGVAAALRGWFKWPRLHEKTVALIVALLLTSPLTIGSLAIGDLLFIGLAYASLAVEYAGILVGLRLTRPTVSYLGE